MRARRPPTNVEATVSSRAPDEDPPTTHYAPFELDGLLRDEATTTVRAEARAPLIEPTLIDVSVQPGRAPLAEPLPKATPRSPIAAPEAMHASSAAPERKPSQLRRLAYVAGVASVLLLAGWLVLQRSNPAPTTTSTAPARAPTLPTHDPAPQPPAPATHDDFERTLVTPAPMPSLAPTPKPAPSAQPKPPATDSASARTALAVRLLLDSDYASAASAYAALAEALPREPVYAVLARNLKELAARRCEPNSSVVSDSPCPSPRSTP